jgi:Flp pilus assembly pilin Flp
MLQKFLKKTKGQNTAEYALLIALVVAGVIAMQHYAQSSLQARMRDASQFMTKQTSTIGKTEQYEPYYLKSDYNVTRDSTENTRLGEGLVAKDAATNRTRATGGFESTSAPLENPDGATSVVSQ